MGDPPTPPYYYCEELCSSFGANRIIIVIVDCIILDPFLSYIYTQIAKKWIKNSLQLCIIIVIGHCIILNTR